jgi:hypothetical protein
MKTSVLFVLSVLSFGAFAQTTNVTKLTANDRLTGNLKVPTGKTLTVESGGTLNVTGATLTGFPSPSSAWADITGKPTTLSGYGITDAAPLASPTFTGTVTIPSGASISGYLTSATAAITYEPKIGSMIRLTDDVSGFYLQIEPESPLAANTIISIPASGVLSPDGTAVLTNKTLSGSANTITNLSASNITSGTLNIARLADASVTLAKLSASGTASSSTYLRGDGAWSEIDLSGYLTTGTAASTYLPLAGGSMTGAISFLGTTHAGIRLINLTTAQRNALSALSGNLIYNASTTNLDYYTGTAWTSLVTTGTNTFTGLQQFSGTTHAGLRLNNLTTAERDALTGSAGMVIWNTTAARMQLHNGTSWTVGMVRLDGDTMTGTLNGTAIAMTPAANTTALAGTISLTGSGTQPALDLTATWNTTGVATLIRASLTNTASNSTSRLLDLIVGGSSRYAIDASLNAVVTVGGQTMITHNFGGNGRIKFCGSTGVFINPNIEVALPSSSILGWVSTSTGAGNIGQDTAMARSAAGVIVLTNGSTGGSAMQLREMTAPSAVTNSAIIYTEDDGAGKTRLMVRFGSGAPQQLSIEP